VYRRAGRRASTTAIVTGIRLRCPTAAELDEAGYDPPYIYLHQIRA
jgi:hypothetical protein